jgi:hypothetical protein
LVTVCCEAFGSRPVVVVAISIYWPDCPVGDA